MKKGLTAEPGTVEFFRQLLEIAESSEHPMDKALIKVLSEQIEEAEQYKLHESAVAARERLSKSKGGKNISKGDRAEPEALKFLIDDDWIKMGNEVLVLADPITYVPIVTIESLAHDTLNWFDENGDFEIGSRANPEHVKAWRAWHKREGFPDPMGGQNES